MPAPGNKASSSFVGWIRNRASHDDPRCSGLSALPNRAVGSVTGDTVRFPNHFPVLPGWAPCPGRPIEPSPASVPLRKPSRSAREPALRCRNNLHHLFDGLARDASHLRIRQVPKPILPVYYATPAPTGSSLTSSRMRVAAAPCQD